eukprot:TRINITY_DN4202_c0_g1_i9.p2 TRINITY_DN4202_c0_g1~~TRINITY_DN4202_c0_g1_i9.p2  ORF type:complete len:218 (+),score=-21.23 TRINITY_DN4202_c0_g1_i9:271-924(+)
MYACVRKILITYSSKKNLKSCEYQFQLQNNFQKNRYIQVLNQKIPKYQYKTINQRQIQRLTNNKQLTNLDQKIKHKLTNSFKQIHLNKNQHYIFNIYYTIIYSLGIQKFHAIVYVSHLQQLQHYIFEVYSSLCNKNYYHHKTIKNQKILEPATQHINKFQSIYIEQSNTTYTLTSLKNFNTIQPRILIQTYLFKLYIQSKNMQYKIGQHILHTQIHF